MLFAYLKNLKSYFVRLASEPQSKTNVTIVSLAGFDRAARPPPVHRIYTAPLLMIY